LTTLGQSFFPKKGTKIMENGIKIMEPLKREMPWVIQAPRAVPLAKGDSAGNRTLVIAN